MQALGLLGEVLPGAIVEESEVALSARTLLVRICLVLELFEQALF